MTDTRVDEVLRFWFGTESDDAKLADAHSTLWFGASGEDDQRIRAQFESILAQAEAGALDGWAQTPRGCLALIVVLDQFSRVIGRGTPRAFSNDAAALGWARACVESGAADTLRPIERSFVYLPFEHAEDAAAQDRSVALFDALAAGVRPAWRARFEEIAAFAHRHRAVVERFGRFPRRNETLGRRSTAAERAYLESSTGSF